MGSREAHLEKASLTVVLNYTAKLARSSKESRNLKSVLSALLFERKITQAKLARETMIPPQTINNWLCGREPKSIKQIKTVANYFEVSIDYLVFGDKNSIPQFTRIDASEYGL